MARGWESKAVEAQQAEAGQKSADPHRKMTAEDAERQRTKTGLLLSRKRVLQQLETSQNPRHRQMLQAALDELDERLREIEA
ncbi:MAG TPA: hypothetical protein VMD99_17245 [Terriglobales bacterium]|nr:hypothetical protein [Terriglobales bacterium]